MAINHINKKVEQSIIKKLEEKYNRTETRANIMISFGENGENKLVGAQFETQNNQYLGIYALISGDEISVKEFPEEDPDDTNCVWRVDDGGKFNISSEGVNSLLKNKDGYWFMMDYFSPESVSSYFLIQQGDALIDDEESSFGRYVGAV